MAAPIGALRAEMSAGYAQFARDMGKAKNAVKKNATGMQRAMAGAKKGFDLTLKSIKVMGVAAIAGAAIIGRMIKKQIDFADSAQKTAEGIGTTVETLTALKHAADLSGVSFEGLQKGMKAITKRSADAASGMKEYKETFDLVGISVTDASGKLKSSEALILEVADKFALMKDGAGKTAIALELFGKSGADLIPLLNSGSAGIKEMTDEAKALGLVLDTETAEAAERFNDNLTRLGGMLTGVFLQTLPKVLPILESYTEDMVEAGKETDEFGKTVNETFSDKLADSIKKLALGLGFISAGYVELRGQIIKTVAWLVRLYEADKALDTFNFKKWIETMRGEHDTPWITEQLKIAGEHADRADKKMVKLLNTIAGIDDKPKKIIDIPKELIEAPKIIDPAAEKGDAKTKQNEVIAGEKEYQALLKEGESLTKSLRTENEVYIDTLNRLFLLKKDGIINEETYNRAVKEADEALKSSGDTADEVGDRFSELTMTINGWARDSADAIVEFATEGKDSFSDMIDSMLKDLLRMAVTKSITEPIFKMFGGVLSGGIGSVFGGRAVGGSVSSNGIYEVNERRPEIFNLGGREFLSTASQNGRVIPNNDGASSGLTISVPVTVAQRNPAMQAELRQEIEYTVENVIRRHA